MSPTNFDQCEMTSSFQELRLSQLMPGLVPSGSWPVDSTSGFSTVDDLTTVVSQQQSESSAAVGGAVRHHGQGLWNQRSTRRQVGI